MRKFNLTLIIAILSGVIEVIKNVIWQITEALESCRSSFNSY